MQADLIESFADAVRDTLPKSAQRHVAAIVAEFTEIITSVTAIEIIGARVPVDTLEIGDCTVSIDTLGNAVSVSFARPVLVEVEV